MSHENPFYSGPKTPQRLPRRTIPMKDLRRMSNVLIAEAESPDCDPDRKLRIAELIIKLDAAQKRQRRSSK
jgi:hypothetical protein